MFFRTFVVFGLLTDALVINGDPKNAAESECLHLEVSITQNIEHEGFHRDIKWLVELLTPSKETWQKSMCELALRIDIPQGMYVNPDQIADLERSEKLFASIEGRVNVEVPLHEATNHTVYIYMNNTKIEKTLLTLPIHLRYQRAQIGGGFGKVILPRPNLLVFCLSNTVICGNGNQVVIPTNSIRPGTPKPWKNVTYQAAFQEAELFVPIGDLDHYPMVSVVTLLLGCTGCIYILSVLKIVNF